MSHGTFFPFRMRQVVTKTGEWSEDWLAAMRRLSGSYGAWEDVPYAAGAFTASGTMTWTVEAADQVTFAYTLMGRRLEVAFVIRGAVIGGVVGPTLYIAIPGKDARGNPLAAATDMTATVLLNDNGTKAIGVAKVESADVVIAIEKVNGANWTAGSGGVEGVIAFEVQ